LGAWRTLGMTRVQEWIAQFVRYGVCGVLATMADAATFYLMSWWVCPALRPDDPVAKWIRRTPPSVPESQRAIRFVVNNIVAFVVANLVAYVLNVRWVFQPGRHSLWLEVGLFYLVSVGSAGLGALLGWLAIRLGGWGTTPAYALKIMTAVLVNFVGRKWFVFAG